MSVSFDCIWALPPERGTSRPAAPAQQARSTSLPARTALAEPAAGRDVPRSAPHRVGYCRWLCENAPLSFLLLSLVLDFGLSDDLVVFQGDPSHASFDANAD